MAWLDAQIEMNNRKWLAAVAVVAVLVSGIWMLTRSGARQAALEHPSGKEVTSVPPQASMSPANLIHQERSAGLGSKRSGMRVSEPLWLGEIITPDPEDAATETDPRRVWLHEAEVVAEDLLNGRPQLAEAASMLADLIESASGEDLEWRTTDGVQTCVLLKSDDLGEATIHFNPQLVGSLGEFQVELSYFDPPGAWEPGEARSSSLRFDFGVSKSGTVEYCSALLQSNLKRFEDGGPEDNMDPRASGALLRASADGASLQRLTTHTADDGNRAYVLQDPEAVEVGSLNSPELTRLSRVLSAFRSSD